jgi:hypothetical protein
MYRTAAYIDPMALNRSCCLLLHQDTSKVSEYVLPRVVA